MADEQETTTARQSSSVAWLLFPFGIGLAVTAAVYHCLVAYGFRDFDRRTIIHSIAGCFFYGAFAAKLIVVRSRRLPGWALPVAGGTIVALVVVLSYSAALWYFNNFDSPDLSPSANVVRATYPGYPTIAAANGLAERKLDDLPDTQAAQRAAIIGWRTGLSVLADRAGVDLPADLHQAGRGEIAPAPDSS